MSYTIQQGTRRIYHAHFNGRLIGEVVGTQSGGCVAIVVTPHGVQRWGASALVVESIDKPVFVLLRPSGVCGAFDAPQQADEAGQWFERVGHYQEVRGWSLKRGHALPQPHPVN